MTDEENEIQARKEFLDHARMLVKHWAKVDDKTHSTEAKISGAIFSLLAALDGGSGIPRYDLISEDDIWINRDCDLHELFYIKEETK